MSVLQNYRQFDGIHWETGTVRNYYDYCAVKAPHTGQPYSEALLMGISGGVVMGYFVFAYKGYDPHARILTRNTFDPMETMLQRLGAVQEIRQTASADKAVANLVDVLTDGTPAITWVDVFRLPYDHNHMNGTSGICYLSSSSATTRTLILSQLRTGPGYP